MTPKSNPSRRMPHRAQDDDPSTSQRGTPSSTRLANIPKEILEEAKDVLRIYISSEQDDQGIMSVLDIVWAIVERTLLRDPEMENRLASNEEFRKNVKRKGEKKFVESLKAMAASSGTSMQLEGNKPWEDLFEDEVFLTKVTSTPAQKAVERAWQRPFEGNAAAVLLQTISSYLDKKTDPYSRQAIIVNSSGTGKSRTVDQLATTIITVPMCLRSDLSTGYPPPDAALRSWLLSGGITNKTLLEVQTRLHAFVYALLNVTCVSLKIIDSDSKEGKIPKTMAETKSRQEKLAKTFHHHMTEGQSFQGPNAYRKHFYKEVIQLANEFIGGNRKVKDPYEGGGRVTRVEKAATELAQFVDPSKSLDCNPGQPRWPLVIFSFDEAHILTNNPSMKARETTLFSELRHILQQTSKHAFFSLFISTAGRFNLFFPEVSSDRSDPSRRIQESKLRMLDSITEVGFDELAYHAQEDKIMLRQVVEMNWMCHLGRPLFASIYDAEDSMLKSDILLMEFVKAKLLDGPIKLQNDDRSGSLACLSVRFALEFNMDGTAVDVARTQVERHMRLCLAATAGRDALVTVAGSEPLLTEAAYELMEQTGSNPVHHLANHLDLNCVDRGRRGELVASLLIMQACDAARRKASDQRWVPVNLFMKELLPEEPYETLEESLPTFYRGKEDKTFAATFKDYGIWFNHVIKVEKDNMYSADHLWKFITRGAMILCTNDQQGVDIVIPICHTEKALSRDSVTAILVQVKNAEKYQSNIDKTSFDNMTPMRLGLFPDNVVPKPVIRIVFDLAAVTAGVHFPEARQHDDGFTAFDVWCAGLGKDAFRNTEGDLRSYEYLLERSLRPHDAFELKDDVKGSGEGHAKTRDLRGTLRRRMVPLTTDNVLEKRRRARVGSEGIAGEGRAQEGFKRARVSQL